MKYDHVIWDWNGTLLEDVTFCVLLINEILTEKSMKTLSIEEYQNVFTIPVIEYYKAVGFDFNEESFESIGKRFIEKYEKRKYECSLYSDAVETLEYFKNNNISQSVLSGYLQETLDEIISEFDLTKYFDHLVGMNDIYAGSKVSNGKRLMDLINPAHKNILLIGDTTHDYEVATSIGADCALLTRGHQSRERLQKIGAPVFENLHELVEYL